MPKLQDEKDILLEAFRKQVLDEMVNGPENLNRKNYELRKHEIYRDMNSKWVLDALIRENYKPSTIAQMANRATNVSICRKIVNKLAQAYMGGVSRELPDDEKSQEAIGELAEYLDFDSVMKKADRYRQLFRNTEVMIVPKVDSTDEEEKKYYLCPKVLAPWEYDVIEDPDDLTKKKVLILADFPERQSFQVPLSGVDAVRASQGFRNVNAINLGASDGKDQTIADSGDDKGNEKREFIWWSDNYHFTTDINGKIIKSPGAGHVNPIGRLPSVTVCGDQDGNFWAQGGDDIIDGSILINKLLTDINFISFVQGWGQLVITGKDLPNRIEGGPDNALVFEVREGDPAPNVFFATSNPPIDKWLETVRMSLAMILSTNNLSPRSISASLDVSNAASGVAILIDQSEVTTDIEDVQKIFQDKEPEIWEVIRRWHGYYYGLKALNEELTEIAPFENADVKLKFHAVKPVVTEKEKLEAIKLRKELALNTQAELLMIDNPDLTKEEAEEKADAANKERQENQAEAMKNMVKSGVGIVNPNKAGAKDVPFKKVGEANGRPNSFNKS